jgi:ankyrin repeat protein
MKASACCFDIAKDSTALHVAAWKAWPNAVKLLIERGANVNAQDAKGRTPLMLAVKACVDSYWTNRRSPASVEALLKARASISGVDYPCGYAEVDALLQSKRFGN